MIDMKTMASSTEVKQTTQFADSQRDQVETTTPIVDPTFMAGNTPDYDNNSYFNRPVLIQRPTWSVNTPFLFYSQLSSTLIRQPQFQNRLESYAYFRGKVKAKIVVNGSPFWYGRLIAAFIPYAPNNEAWIDASNELTGRTITYMSQLPHVFIDPNSSNSVEIDVPPYMVRNWLRLSVLDDAEQLGDFTNQPYFCIASINDLKNADSASTGSINVSIYAWFEDVELAVPTGSAVSVVAPSISNQGRRRTVTINPPRDQEALDSANKKPTISSVASTISTGLGTMSSVPIIGPFAKAGSFISGAVSSVAKLFGFSRPLILADTQRFYPEAIPNLSSTSGGYSGNKMSIDPLQGVTVDPRVAMLDGTDEMSIQYIASKESYFHTYTITSSTQAIGSFLVTPMLSLIEGNVEQFSACAFAAFPYNYWRGSVKVRFQVVASSFHRARIGIIYDPLADSDLVVVDGPYHRHFNLVMDLEELDGLELEIPWLSAFPYLKSTDDISQANFTTPTRYADGNTRLTGPYDHNNGVIKLVMINELVSTTEPVTDVYINCYVSCPDLQVAFLDSISRLGYHPTPTTSQVSNQGFIKDICGKISCIKEVEPCSICDSCEAEIDIKLDVSPQGFGREPDETIALSIGEAVCDDNFPKVFFGEDIKSFRTVLKRFSSVLYVQSLIAPNQIGYQYRYTPLPPLKYDGTATGGITLNASLHMIEYLRFAYFAQRGSIRSNYIASVKNGKIAYHQASTIQNMTSGGVPPIFGGGAGVLGSTRTSGTVLNPAEQNNSISFETPFYTANRYLIACDNNFGFGSFGFDQFYPIIEIYTMIDGTWTENNEARSKIDMAAGDDFSFMGFMAAPAHRIRAPT